MPRAFELRELPLKVVENMFRSVSFLDKLRCEQTCKDWRDFMRTELAPKTVTISLLQGTHLKPWVAAPASDNLSFMVPVESTSAAHSFVAWFVRRTAGLKQLILDTPISVFCRFPCLQLFDHILAELSLQAGATFHGTLGMPILTESFSTCFLW